MTHGVQGYFIERGRASRRVALIAVSLAVTGLAPLIALNLPSFRRPMRELIRLTARFGYEGPDQFVRRISLQPHSGSNIITRELGATLEATHKVFGIEKEPLMTRFAASELSHAQWFDISAARKDLGYAPRVSIAEGLERVKAAHIR